MLVSSFVHPLSLPCQHVNYGVAGLLQLVRFQSLQNAPSKPAGIFIGHVVQQSRQYLQQGKSLLHGHITNSCPKLFHLEQKESGLLFVDFGLGVGLAKVRC